MIALRFQRSCDDHYELCSSLREVSNVTQNDLEEALALSNQIGDPCWQAAAARSLALYRMDAKDYPGAKKWLAYARERCCSVTDLYSGLLVEILTDQVRLATLQGEEQETAALARELLPFAAKTHADAHLDYAMSMMALAGKKNLGSFCNASLIIFVPIYF